jgi:adenylate cyclase
MTSLLELLTPVILRVDAVGRLTPADTRSAAWLEEAGPRSRTLQALCGVQDPRELADGAGPWRSLPDVDGNHLIVGAAWAAPESIAQRIAADSLQDKQVMLNVLPRAVADHLGEAKGLQPKAYREATVVFIDAVQFSRLAARVDPVTCLKQLDFYFSLFDQITTVFGVEKVTTIGDAYMAVAGVPVRRAAHAVDATLAALRVARAIAARPAPVVDEWEWSFRLGLHSGPCISGVLGARRQVFDLWGDTVSVAAHVQRVGRPDAVSVSGATFRLIEPFFDVSFDGTTVVRNAGEVEIYLVRGVRSELLADASEIVVNDAFCDKYRDAYGTPCPEAAWVPQAARQAIFGEVS